MTNKAKEDAIRWLLGEWNSLKYYKGYKDGIIHKTIDIAIAKTREEMNKEKQAELMKLELRELKYEDLLIKKMQKFNGLIKTEEDFFNHVKRVTNCAKCGRVYWDKLCPDCVGNDI